MLHLFETIKTTVVHFAIQNQRKIERIKYSKVWSNRSQVAILNIQTRNLIMLNPLHISITYTV